MLKCGVYGRTKVINPISRADWGIMSTVLMLAKDIPDDRVLVVGRRSPLGPLGNGEARGSEVA